MAAFGKFQKRSASARSGCLTTISFKEALAMLVEEQQAHVLREQRLGRPADDLVMQGRNDTALRPPQQLQADRRSDRDRRDELAPLSPPE
jgi:hypothetical protein